MSKKETIASEISDFEKDKIKDKPCPLCGNPVLFVEGCGWDYDRCWCSKRGCRYEKEYDTTTTIEDKK